MPIRHLLISHWLLNQETPKAENLRQEQRQDLIHAEDDRYQREEYDQDVGNYLEQPDEDALSQIPLAVVDEIVVVRGIGHGGPSRFCSGGPQ